MNSHQQALKYFTDEKRPYWKRICEMNIDSHLLQYFGVEPRFFTK